MIIQCHSRTWDTIVDVSIYSSAINDPYRDVGKAYNPNSSSTENEWTIPPTAPPTTYPISDIIDTIPTATPSTAFSCASEDNTTNTFEAVIKMYDSWGDGWGDTTLIISKRSKPYQLKINISNTTVESFAHLFSVTESKNDMEIVYEGSLVDGNEEHRNICLQPDICYSVEVNGTLTEWQNEIQWDIRRKDDTDGTATTVAKGFAPTKCQFSLPDANNGTYVCAFSCIDDVHNASSSLSPSFSSVPSTIPTITPSNHESNIDSDSPTYITSITPSYRPSAIPTSPSSGGSISIVDTPTSVTLPEDKSSRPSLTSSLMETATFLPTVTFQPTATMYPTSYMSGGSINIAVGGGSSQNANTEYADDDMFLSPPAPVSIPTTERASRQGGTATTYPTKTAHPSAYGADFMNSFENELSANNILSVEEVKTVDDDDTSSSIKQADGRASVFGSTSASMVDNDEKLVLTGTGSASINDGTNVPITGTSSPSLNDDKLPPLTGTSSAKISDDTGTGAASIYDETNAPFTGTSSASLNDDKPPPLTGTSSATIDDDTFTTFASVNIDDDAAISNAGHIKPPADAGEWFQTVVLRAPRRSPNFTPTRRGKNLFESVFSPSFRKPDTQVSNPTRNAFYQFINELRSPSKTVSSSTKPTSDPTRPVVAQAPTRPVTSPMRPTSLGSTPTIPMPTMPGSSSSHDGATYSPTSTIQPTTTYYPTTTAQPTTTFYPTITAYPTIDEN